MNNQLLNAIERLSGETEYTNLTYVSQFDKLYERDYDFFYRLANGTDREYQGPLETLSRINMEDFQVANEAGLTMQDIYSVIDLVVFRKSIILYPKHGMLI